MDFVFLLFFWVSTIVFLVLTLTTISDKRERKFCNFIWMFISSIVLFFSVALIFLVANSGLKNINVESDVTAINSTYKGYVAKGDDELRVVSVVVDYHGCFRDYEANIVFMNGEVFYNGLKDSDNESFFKKLEEIDREGK